MIDPDDQTPEQYIEAALDESFQRTRGVDAIGRPTLDELNEAIGQREIVDGPYFREIPDGRCQYYAYVRVAP